MLDLPNMPVLCVGVSWYSATASLHMLSVGSLLSCYVTTFMQLNLLTPSVLVLNGVLTHTQPQQ